MGFQGIGAFILVVGGLVFIHELGHFIVAKLLGVKVVRFSIGFGPRLLWWTRGETEYRISALPLGGYVKMAGDVPGEEPAPEDRGRGFFEQRPWKRIVIGFAGPAANFAFPILLFTAVGFVLNGNPTPAAAVGAIVPGLAAERAGVRPGDRIVSVARRGAAALGLRWWDYLVDAVSTRPGERLTFTVDRGGRSEAFEIVPALEERDNGVEVERRGVIGITPNWPARVVVPAAPGAAGRLEPFDEVTKVAGAPVAHFGELARAFEAAGCRPVDVEVLRGPEGARATVPIAGVPTCAGGGLSVLPIQRELSAVVGRVEEDGPAAKAGLVPGDVIVQANGAPVRTYHDLDVLDAPLKAGKPIQLTLAGGRRIEFVPRAETVRDRETGEKVQRFMIGFGSAPRDLATLGPVATVAERRGAGEIVASAASDTWRMTRVTAVGIYKILTGQISHRAVGGIIELAKQSSEAASAGVGSLLTLMALV